MRKIITRTKLMELRPCTPRWKNYLHHYGDQSFTVKEFLNLDKITFKDKTWVAFRLMPKENIRFAAGKIARLVLPIYEAKYSNDDRPRKAIRACLRTKRFNKEEALKAARVAAANAAADAAAYAVDAAVYAANAAADAVDAAAYAANAAYAAAANAAAYAATNAANACDKTLNEKAIKILERYWSKK